MSSQLTRTRACMGRIAWLGPEGSTAMTSRLASARPRGRFPHFHGEDLPCGAPHPIIEALASRTHPLRAATTYRTVLRTVRSAEQPHRIKCAILHASQVLRVNRPSTLFDNSPMADAHATVTPRAVLLAVFIAFDTLPILPGFLFGYDIGVISGCLIMPDFINRFGEVGADGTMFLSSSRQSIITSLLSAGTFVGALGQAFTSDSMGRRGSILIWSGIFTVGVAIQTGTTFSLAQLTVGRFIAGLAIVPLYNGETSPKAYRGTLFLSYVIDLGTHTIHNSASWRIPVGLQMVWGLALLSGIFFLPESPRHLLGNGKVEEARAVIADLNGVALDDPVVIDTVDELQYAIGLENEGGKATWAECFSSRNAMWKRTINGMMLQFIQQLNGQNFFYYYGDTFFASAGTSLSPYIIQVIVGGVSVIGTVPALYLIEAWGRRRSLLTGAVLEATCALIGGLVGHYTVAPAGTPKELLTARNKAGGDSLIAFAVLHVMFFSIFWGPTPWVYLGESFPLRVRSKSIALGSATNWLWNFLLGFFAPRIANKIGALIWLIFFGALFFGWFYVYFCIPETKGLSLEEVDELYRSGVKPWHSAGWRPHLHDQHESEKADDVRRRHESVHLRCLGVHVSPPVVLSLPTTMVFCGECGTQGDGRFCTECGARLAEAPMTAAAPGVKSPSISGGTSAGGTGSSIRSSSISVAAAASEGGTSVGRAILGGTNVAGGTSAGGTSSTTTIGGVSASATLIAQPAPAAAPAPAPQQQQSTALFGAQGYRLEAFHIISREIFMGLDRSGYPSGTQLIEPSKVSLFRRLAGKSIPPYFETHVLPYYYLTIGAPCAGSNVLTWEGWNTYLAHKILAGPDEMYAHVGAVLRGLNVQLPWQMQRSDFPPYAYPDAAARELQFQQGVRDMAGAALGGGARYGGLRAGNAGTHANAALMRGAAKAGFGLLGSGFLFN
ncbi:unnamed protein product [Mycena citricolor]|uniref:Major facilitator superfamily (MFS) profile domain-containing protein n=1 Tax=Mycena citricolor TaxID=2018698 RepID=A0AAD2H0K4_9AGAR|nr:unnamed protein product [Mycena citricolor]